MSRYRVFLGAPSPDLFAENEADSYHWRTIASSSTLPPQSSPQIDVLPNETLEAADLRVSMIYRNIIFGRDDEEGAPDPDAEFSDTAISWPPTPPKDNRAENSALSFLLNSASVSKFQSLCETQETQDTGSLDYSEASSIGRFPSFQFDLHDLASLSQIDGPSQKISLLLATLEVEGPDTITIKKGPDAGKEVSVLRLVLADEDGKFCKLTAWREIADSWGGANRKFAVRRGDVVFLENVVATRDDTATNHTATTLTASPYLKSKLDICYRTMPFTQEDKRLRPDLRLGISDAPVRKVASVVAWFERIAGL